MKKSIFLTIVVLFTVTGLFAQTKAGKVDTASHTTFYSCPKHPDITSHNPGKCSKCGTQLGLFNKEQLKKETSKTYVCPVHLELTSHDPGKCPKCGKELNLSAKEQMKAEVTKLFTCPMHPDVSLDKKGICPKCGKTLVEKPKTKASN